MRFLPRRVARSRDAGVLALLLTAALTVTVSAHDPGLSSLDVSLHTSTIVARLSLSPQDADLAASLEDFARGTIEVARAVAEVSGTTVIGGGDSIAAVAKAGVTERITHISTGGGD